MGDLFRFRKFPVYQEARLFRTHLKKISMGNFPKSEQHCLTSQLWRALDSIVLNIAEGSDKYSDVDFGRFLNIALGSLNEVVACLDLALDDSYVNEETVERFAKQAENIGKQLKAFSAKVRSS